MKNNLKKITTVLLAAVLLTMGLTSCGTSKTVYENEISIVLSENEVTAQGKGFDAYGDNVFVSNDVIYYEDKDTYESGNPYGEGTDQDKHTAEEAAAVTVVNIVQPGYYRISGKLSNGQIRVDLGEDAFEDENAVVTLILDGVEINCDIAPAVIFQNVYECDNQWSEETATYTVDTTKAGANVIIADGSTNNISGANVAKIFKDNDKQKKLWKQDGAFYSYMSMNISGEEKESGVLNIYAKNEGLCAELHLTINSGKINIFSQDDGINTNEDNVSVTTVNGGDVRIIAGTGPLYGDGIDSNGWIVINGGTVISAAHPHTDSGIDNEKGCVVNGGTLISIGGIVDWPDRNSTQKMLNLQFKDRISTQTAFIVTDQNDKVVFAYDITQDEVIGSTIRECKGVAICSPEFTVGETYKLYLGGKVSGNGTNGLFDATTAKGFEGAALQMHYSDELFERGGFVYDSSKVYTADTNFVFDSVINCFSDITDFVE